MKKIFASVFLCIGILGLSSCLNLDNNIFNPNTKKISSYTFDKYDGDVDFHLDASYTIPDSLVHLFTLESKAPDEGGSTKIYAIYIGEISRIAVDTVIMYCHGNRDHMDFYWQRAKLLANTLGKNRFGVMMVDYRGFGLSEGSPTENGMYADVDAALSWLKGKGLTGDRLVMYGFSLGSAPATKLTSEPRSLTPYKLLLEAPFASSAVLIEDATGLAMPAEFYTTVKINNAEEIKNVHQPFYWVHGEADDYLNITTNGEIVYANYSGVYKEAHRIPNAGHSDVPVRFGFVNYSQSVGTFITSH